MKFFLLFVFLFPVFTQALEITAHVDKKVLAINEFLVFTIKIQSDKEKPKQWYIPNINFNDFHLLRQWEGQESSIQVINGQMQKKSVISKNYHLQPKTKGTLRIESVTVKTRKKSFTTDPIFITVNEKNKNTPSNPPQIPPSPFFNQSPQSLFDIFKDPFNERETTKNSLKLKLNLSKQSVYRAEMIRADWLILQSSGSIRYDIVKQPSLKGFWKEEIKNINSLAGTVVVDKILYRKTPLNSLWLFPLQTGDLTIDSYSIGINHLLSFHSSRNVQSSPVRKIKVKDLPLKNRDESWTGAVGSFKVYAEIKEKKGAVNQPVSYKITFKGSGHPRFINLPTIDFSSSFQTYTPVENSHFSNQGIGEKEFEILIVPKQEGILKTPSFTLSTFDPQKEKYIFHKIPSFSLFVKKGKLDEEAGQNFFEEGKTQEEEKISLEALNSFFLPQFINHKNLIKVWLFLFCILFIGFIFLYVKNLDFKKEKSLKKQINQKCSVIQKLLDEKDWKKACTQMIYLNDLLLHKAQIKGSYSGWRQALNNLPPSLNKKYSTQFENLFKDLENLSFSSAIHSEKSALNKAKNLFQQTKNLIDSLLPEL